jgi:hypothetical protein
VILAPIPGVTESLTLLALLTVINRLTIQGISEMCDFISGPIDGKFPVMTQNFPLLGFHI